MSKAAWASVTSVVATSAGMEWPPATLSCAADEVVVDLAEGGLHRSVIVGPARRRRVLLEPRREVVGELGAVVDVEQRGGVRVRLEEGHVVEQLFEPGRAAEPLALRPTRRSRPDRPTPPGPRSPTPRPPGSRAAGSPLARVSSRPATGSERSPVSRTVPHRREARSRHPAPRRWRRGSEATRDVTGGELPTCSCLLRDADGPMDRDARPTGRRLPWARDHPGLSVGQARIVAARHLPPRNKKRPPDVPGAVSGLDSD